MTRNVKKRFFLLVALQITPALREKKKKVEGLFQCNIIILNAGKTRLTNSGPGQIPHSHRKDFHKGRCPS